MRHRVKGVKRFQRNVLFIFMGSPVSLADGLWKTIYDCVNDGPTTDILNDVTGLYWARFLYHFTDLVSRCGN